MKKIHKGDLVIVKTGANEKVVKRGVNRPDKFQTGVKNKTGIVKQIIGDEFVIVEGLKLAKKAVKADPSRNEQGGFRTVELPIHISNVALVNPETGKGERVRIMVEKDANGKVQKYRVFAKSGARVPEPKKDEAK